MAKERTSSDLVERRLNVFLCHASEDKRAVREISRRLRQDGFEPWLDEEKLIPGQEWSLEIANAVRRADAVVVCLSKTSVTKEGYLQRELRQALEVAEEKPEHTLFIIPLKLEECEVPERLARWQWAPYYDHAGYGRLVAALRRRAKDRGIALTPAGQGQAWPWLPRSRKAILAAMLVVVGAGAGAVKLVQLRNGQPAPLDLPSRNESVPQPPGEPQGMVSIPAGHFLMGRERAGFTVEGPAHAVTVPAFHLDRRLVTNAEYERFARAAHRPVPPHGSSSVPPPGQGSFPVTRVSWEDAQAYCRASGNRLPSEAEWEYAARGGEQLLYPWGNDFRPQLVNSLEAGAGRVTAGGRNTSRFGVEDLSGNLWQWCADDFRPYPGAHLPIRIPDGAKVLRGGSFRADKNHVTTTARNFERASVLSDEIGFRCAR